MNKRITSNEEIIPRIAEWKVSNALDEPKRIALLALILDRLGKLEDEADTQQSLSDIVDQTQQQTSSLIDTGSDTTPVEETLQPSVIPPEEQATETISEPIPPVEETPTDSVPATSPDAPQAPVEAPPVQTADQTPTDTGTISQLTPDAIANGTDTPPVETPPVDTTPTSS